MHRRLFFLHLPKTAGTTFNAFLEQQYRLADIMPYGCFGEREVYLQPDQLEVHRQKQPFLLYRGHFGYDVCKLFESEFTTITVLRDPLQRVVSLYNDWRTKSEESLAEAPELEKSLAVLAQTLSLRDFLRAEHPHLPLWFHNGQARLLAQGFHCKLPESTLQDIAIAHLDNIDYVGVTGAFELLLWLLCHQFGWHYPSQLQPLNAARNRLRVEDLDDATRADIAAQNQVDWVLYRRAQMRALAIANQVVQQSPPAKTYLDRQSADAIKITMADALPGTGWHVREGEPSDRLWRWTGPTLAASLFVRLTPQRYRLEIRVISVIDASILQGCEISIDNTPITTIVRNDGQDFMIEGDIPAELIKRDEPICLRIMVPRTMSPQAVDPNATDTRQKGLAIQAIGFEPIQGSDQKVNNWKVNRMVRTIKKSST